MAVFRLSRNCRNTRQIAARVSAIWGDGDTPHGAYGREPEFVEASNVEGAKAALKGILHRLINEGRLAADQVVVLCQKRSQFEALTGSVVAGVRLGSTVPSSSAVQLETIHRFKGLESDAVVVLLQSVESEQHLALAYVGLSRACAELVVVAPPGARAVLNWD